MKYAHMRALFHSFGVSAVSETEYRRRMLAARYPRLWHPTLGPVPGPGLAASRKVVLGLPSTVRYLM